MDLSLGFSLPPLHLIPDDNRSTLNWNLKVSDVIENNCWNRDRLQQLLDVDVARKICEITIPNYNMRDFFIWEHSASRDFFVKSATWIQGNDNQEIKRKNMLKKMQKLKIPPKVKIFA
ncbi:hypothetical protein ACFX19_044666 [Malus domestica]